MQIKPSRRTRATLIAAAIATFSVPSLVGAQSAGDAQLRNIQLSGIGTGFTVDSINNSVLQSSRAQVPQTGVNNFQAFNTSITSGQTLARPSFSLGGPGGSGSKPFAGLSNGPTVSPYLNLFNDNGIGNGVDNYNTLVRPMLNQQRTNQALQRQTQELNRRVQQISAQGAFNAQGSERMSPTGHSTGFFYYGRYYPGLNRRR